MNQNNPFFDDDSIQNNDDNQSQDNPFIAPSVLKNDNKEESPKQGIFHKDNSQEEKIVTLSLKDVQRMSFPEENNNLNMNNPTTTPDYNNDSFDAAVNRSLDWMHSFKTTFRKIRRILEIVLIIGLIAFGTIKYRDYSKKANQLLIYQYGSETFEIRRSQYIYHIEQKKEVCDEECNVVSVKEFDSSLNNFQSILASIYFDFSFKFSNGSKQINGKNLNSSFSSNVVYSLIHNDSKFLSFSKNRGYSIIDYEQLSENKIRGFYYEEKQGHFYVTISLGLKETTGYSINVYDVHETDSDFIIYISETIPKTENKWINENAPTVYLELNNKPNSIRVLNIKNGEEFRNYDVIMAG